MFSLRAPSFKAYYYEMLPILIAQGLLDSLHLGLKKCVVPTRDAVSVGVIFPVVHLAYDDQIVLVLAVIASMWVGLWKIVMPCVR